MPREVPGTSNMPPPPRRIQPGDSVADTRSAGDDDRADAFRRALGSDRTREVIHALIEADGQLPIAELQVQAGLSFLEFTSVLAELTEEGLLTVDGPPGHETVSLFDKD
ncbi:hypothetical protein ABZ897_31625 [Nonomuraea sp. NPDC046802]|uniref:hypothetical protein n=1 Tax=Nonomuraea sp. NPDC046802 TaxID=3154919 RepID=UPI0034063E5F